MTSGQVAGSFVLPNFEFFCSHTSSNALGDEVPSLLLPHKLQLITVDNRCLLYLTAFPRASFVAVKCGIIASVQRAMQSVVNVKT